jgi:aminoglycoside 3-N-acetyltransferase
MTYTKKDIISALEKMNAPQGSVVLMHISLRSVGDVEGGAQALLDALIEYFTAKGGLFCVPTHTWDNLGKDKITLDMQNPESNLGAFTELAARDKRGVRSENPTHSMMVFGDRQKALDFVAGEEKVPTPTDPESCYGKLYKMGGFVLLVGVAQDKNTFLHCAEQILDIPDRMATEPIKVTVRKESGELYRRELTLFDCSFTDDISLQFTKYDTAFRYHRAITDGFIGSAPAQLCSTVRMKEAMELIFSRSEGRDPLSDKEPIPPKFYTK